MTTARRTTNTRNTYTPDIPTDRIDKVAAIRHTTGITHTPHSHKTDTNNGKDTPSSVGQTTTPETTTKGRNKSTALRHTTSTGDITTTSSSSFSSVMDNPISARQTSTTTIANFSTTAKPIINTKDTRDSHTPTSINTRHTTTSTITRDTHTPALHTTSLSTDNNDTPSSASGIESITMDSKTFLNASNTTNTKTNTTTNTSSNTTSLTGVATQEHRQGKQTSGDYEDERETAMNVLTLAEDASPASPNHPLIPTLRTPSLAPASQPRTPSQPALGETEVPSSNHLDEGSGSEWEEKWEVMVGDRDMINSEMRPHFTPLEIDKVTEVTTNAGTGPHFTPLEADKVTEVTTNTETSPHFSPLDIDTAMEDTTMAETTPHISSREEGTTAGVSSKITLDIDGVEGSVKTTRTEGVTDAGEDAVQDQEGSTEAVSMRKQNDGTYENPPCRIMCRENGNREMRDRKILSEEDKDESIEKTSSSSSSSSLKIHNNNHKDEDDTKNSSSSSSSSSKAYSDVSEDEIVRNFRKILQEAHATIQRFRKDFQSPGHVTFANATPAVPWERFLAGKAERARGGNNNNIKETNTTSNVSTPPPDATPPKSTSSDTTEVDITTNTTTNTTEGHDAGTTEDRNPLKPSTKRNPIRHSARKRKSGRSTRERGKGDRKRKRKGGGKKNKKG